LRQLRKVIFINSAGIRYQEILLDGNVHLIGTQGVGKSTILRTILFFYNADTQKLGIPPEKKPYAEYYYPFTNSYILYEIQRENGAFTVLTMRSGPSIAFRFIDAPYNPEWLIQDQKAKSSWQDIRVTLDQAGIDYSNKIDRLGEFRDIIYGNTGAKKAYQKYALLESKQYQNLPRTITNVFLNAKLEADFIKETIINSLSEEPLAIDLTKYSHHLAEFELEYGDVQKFKDPKALQQADAIIDHYNTILQQQSELYRKAAQLKDGIQKAEETKTELTRELETKKGQKQELEQKFEEAEKRHNQQKDQHNTNIKYYDKQIREARKKDREYREKGIGDILRRVEKQQEWQNEEKRLQDERQTLTAKFESVEQYYQVRINQSDNNLSRLANEQAAEKNKAHQQFYEQKETAQADKDQHIQKLSAEHQEKRDALDEEYQEAYEQWSHLREKRSKLESQRFYEQDLKQLDDQIRQAQERIVNIHSEIKLNQKEIDQLQKEWQREEEQYQSQQEQTKSGLNQEKENKKAELQKLKTKIDRYQSALYGFLKENYPGWEQTIGKVFREDVLFSENLNPELKANDGTFDGLQIDLDNLDTSAKSIQGYEEEVKALEERLSSIEQELQKGEETFRQNQNNLKKRFQPKIREYKDQNKQLEVEQSNKNQHIEQWKIEREDLAQRAESEKQKALNEVDQEFQKVNEQFKALKEKQSKLSADFEKARKKAENAYKQKLKKLEKALDQDLQEIDQRYQSRIDEEQARKKELEAEKTQALKEKGANTERLEELDARLAEIRNELRFITDHQTLVVEYRKDKRELIDRVDEMKAEKAKEAEKLEQAEEKFEKRRQAHRKDMEERQQAIDQLQKQLDQIEEGFQAFEQFSQTDFFTEEIAPQMIEGREAGDPFTLSAYVNQIRDARDDLLDRKRKLSETANRYLARFSDANLFSFNVNLIDDQDYMNFAANLKEFVDLNKIEELEKRVNRRFADILNLVAKQTQDMISREGEIQHIITRINNDFRDKNFVGVISSIEIKMEESADRVVNMLKRIRQFDQEKGLALGEANLFNQGNADQQNERAVELLRQLNQDIKDTRKETIALADAFELRFRVVENENDTGWVEKLSNVGSEGTDILVKAMINIMLLNVFKGSASKKFKDFKLHCVMDEIGRLHPSNVHGILKFANDRNILLINGSPVVQDAMAYRHIYELRKDQDSQTRIKRLISVSDQAEVKSAR
jgi:hypothetical protein